ncbi:hypothetical protein ACWA06_19165 [Serratia rhizosphaerae]
MLFNNNDWKLKVTDINLYEDTVSIEGVQQSLSYAIKVTIPAYLSGFGPRNSTALALLEQLEQAGIKLTNFFSQERVDAYRLHQSNKLKEAERLAREQQLQEQRLKEERMSNAEWQQELQRREKVRAERRTYGDNLRSQTASTGRSRASMMADIASTGNWMDKL